MSKIDGVNLNYYNSSLNNVNKNNSPYILDNFFLNDNDNDNDNDNYNDNYKLQKKIKELEKNIYIEREEYKEYYKKTRDFEFDSFNAEKINNYDNINNKLKYYIQLCGQKQNENEILERKYTLLNDKLKNENEILERKNRLLNDKLKNLKEYNTNKSLEIKKEVINFDNNINRLEYTIGILNIENNELKSYIDNKK